MASSRKLETFNIPHLGMVLDEIFAIPGPKLLGSAALPTDTVADVAEQSGLDIEQVLQILEGLAQMSEGVEISCSELSGRLHHGGPTKDSSLVLLDVREKWEYERAHIPDSLLLAELDFPTFLQEVKEKDKEIITICHHGVRSFNAAMYLKQQGLKRVRSLAGGIDQWAEEIDPTLDRY